MAAGSCRRGMESAGDAVRAGERRGSITPELRGGIGSPSQIEKSRGGATARVRVLQPSAAEVISSGKGNLKGIRAVFWESVDAFEIRFPSVRR